MKLQLLIAGILAISCVPMHAKDRDKDKDQQGSKVTLKGCLEKGSQPDQYRISEKGITYDLFSAGNVNLAEHVGHKVEVKGTVANAETTSPNTASRTSEERVDVTSVKHVSKTCP